MAGSTNDRNRSFKGATKGNFNGRSDYSSGRPKKGVDSIPDMGDKGIPAGITSSKEYVETKQSQTPTTAASKGIPPMNADPKGIGITIKGVTTKDPHI
jgi:hypothetical protein